MRSCATIDPEDSKGFSWLVFLCTILCWVFTFAATRTGTKSMSYVVYATVPIPCLLLIILGSRVVWLDGAGDGIKQYLTGDPDEDNVFKNLEKSTIWAEAAG